MKIYTKVGDDGATGLIGGIRVSKDHARIEAYGTLDELSASLGWVLALAQRPGTADDATGLTQMIRDLESLLPAIQSDLFVMGAQLATPDGHPNGVGCLGESDVQRLEKAIDEAEIGLAPLRNFILPGGAPLSAALHLSRVVCRRAERRVVTLGHLVEIPAFLIPYLNRLSDLLFVLARRANCAVGTEDVPWIPRSKSEA
jgi:cob(I)alamin adenosyltransferase